MIPPDVAERAEGFAGRGWVVRSVADWIDAGTERFLVVTGEPGSGKTALAAWLAGAGPPPRDPRDAEALERVRASWTAVHFCIARKDGTVDAEAFTELLVDALAAALAPDFLPAVARANELVINAPITARSINAPVTGAQIANLVLSKQSRSDVAANVVALWADAVREPLRELERSGRRPEAVILVDGLDEAARASRPTIVDLLAGSDDLPAGVRFLVTASTDLDVRAIFPGAAVIDLSSAEAGAEALANEDVRAFVREQLPGLTPVADDRLVAAAAGNFLYVRFLVEEVVRGDRSRESLELDGGLEGLPNGLFPLYRQYLDRVTGAGRGVRAGTAWDRDLQPLLGCISVATPAAPQDALARWLRRDPGRVGRLLDQTRQVTEPDESDEGPGHRLYHRSMGDYLAAAQYATNGSRTTNPYYTPPEPQHARIARHYLRNFQGADWAQADRYGLRHVVRHLAAVVRSEPLPAERRKRAAELYRTVLDPDFQAAQRATLGNLHQTLADLRVGLDVALAGEEIVPLLRCVSAYRALARSGALVSSIFEAVDRADFEAAVRDAAHYGPPPRPRGRWARVLDAWIAWQAARSGRVEAAAAAAEGVVGRWVTTEGEAEPLYWELCRALVVRAGRELLRAGRDPAPLLGVFADRQPELAAEVGSAPEPPPGDAEAAELQEALAGHLRELELQLRDDPYEAVEVPFASPEYQAYRATTLRGTLVALAHHPAGQAGIDRVLDPTLGNPYTRYRDIGLVAIGTAVVSVPDDAWADRRLRSILLAGLDAEGVTFSFELPTLLVEEAGRRGRSPGPLAEHVARAGACVEAPDRWTSGLRALAARAAALAALGDRDAAFDALVEASRQPVGFAGHAAIAYLHLATRAVELGRADEVRRARWGPNDSWALPELAAEHARRVLDEAFRTERSALVERYTAWLDEPPPDLEAVLAFVAATPDPDARRTYKDYASACWSQAGTAEARGWLKALVSMVLEDTTTLDAILRRVVAPRLDGLSDRELGEAIEVVAGGLTDGRPWTAETWAGQQEPAEVTG